MDARIRVVNGELPDLERWLQHEGELRGRVDVVRAPIGETELGALPELLTVTLGSGGAVTALVSAVKVWLKTRQTTATITVETGEHTVTLDIRTVDDVAPLLEKALDIGNDD
jgi:hypothetical protein